MSTPISSRTLVSNHSTNTVIQDLADPHYDRVPKSYHKAWFYEKDSPFERWQLDLIAKLFSPIDDRKASKVVDIGGGTGRFAQLLFKRLELEQPVLCVDPFESMLNEAKVLQGVSTQKDDACAFALKQDDLSLDRILLKEVVHHVEHVKLTSLFSELYRASKPGAVVLVVTRPKENIDYPMMEKAHQVWRENQEDSDVYLNCIKEAGFVDVKADVQNFPVTMNLGVWLDMIRNRMWSTFSEIHFSAQELEKGLEEIRNTCSVDAGGNISFDERLVFISGKKKF